MPIISRLPPWTKSVACDLLVAVNYYSLALLSMALEWLCSNVDRIPLSYYKDYGFFTMRTDARDRFAPPL